MKNIQSALSALGRRTADPSISWLMRLALDHPHLISLAAGFTDNPSLPLSETRAIVEKLLASRKAGSRVLQYGSTPGDPQLRRLTAEHIAQQDAAAGAGNSAAACTPERVLITNGSQQLLYMTVEALCDPGDIVLVEDPTYFVFLGIVQSHGLRCRGLRLEEDGVELAALERALEGLKQSGELARVKLLYLVSYLQNPTGRTTRLEKKAAALELLRHYERAAGHPIFLLEDAAYRELRFAGDDVPSALAADPDGERVIYTSTYSKPFASGIRAGYGVLPPALRDVVRRIKGNHDFGTANLVQQILSQALASGKYQSHLKPLRRRYARKAAVMGQALRDHFPETVQWAEPEGGLYFWARLPKSQATGMRSRLFKSVLAHDVLYVPGELCYADDPGRRKPNHEMRLSFGSASEADIREAIARLGRALTEPTRR